MNNISGFIPIYPFIYPVIPQYNQQPPTVYSILQSIVNYKKIPKTKVKDLAKYGRDKIFDFDYPLTNKITKEDFECMILNHFMMRRIGFETVTLFSLQLDIKLNSIMPMFNKMFDMLDGWDVFNDGEITTKTGTVKDIQETLNTETRQNEIITKNINNESKQSQNTSNTSNTLQNTASNTTNNLQDRRESDTPQNELSEIRDGNYVTKYNYDSSNTTSNDSANSTGTANTTTNDSTNITNTTNSNTNENTQNQSTGNSEKNNIYEETIKRTPAEKLELFKEFQTNLQNIYSLLFNELEDLFYQLA